MRLTNTTSDASVAHNLRRVKLLHTVVWAFFVASILAVPLAAWFNHYRVSLICGLVVACEVLVLVFNGWRCPLTNVAAQYTSDRRDNFDIYLPEWLARHNKAIFGALYVCGVIAALGWRYGWIPR